MLFPLTVFVFNYIPTAFLMFKLAKTPRILTLDVASIFDKNFVKASSKVTIRLCVFCKCMYSHIAKGKC